MGSWIFMFVINLIIPFTMIGFGLLFLYKIPKKINYIFGYRTTMSMKNEDTWKFAHYYIGKLWNILGWILLVISSLLMIWLFNKDENTIDKLSLVLLVVQMIFLIGPVIPIEIALKKTFDKDGNFK